ncbi:MAG: extracellular solute-binding protein, partial [Lachnospiraceae bacterium]|nr:extracellular solute-binding protein [Lachnospiraceae bacterium]
MKKFLATLLASVMVVSCLAGCGKTDDKTETKSSAVESSVVSTADGEMTLAQKAIADRKAEAEKTGKYKKVVVSFFDWTGAPAGLDRINQKLSAHTEETLGVDVELLIIDSAAYSDDIKLMLSSGEQVDLFSTCGPGYMTCVNNGYTADLEENGLLDNYGAGLKDVVRSDYFDACRVGGKLFGVPPIKDYAIQTAAVCIGTEYLEGAGVDLSKFGKDSLGYYKCTWEDIDDMFAKMHAAFPDKIVYSTQDNMLSQGSCVDPVGGDYYGSLLDPANSLKVENVYESEIFKTWCERFFRWNQAGYISGDALTDKNGASARIKSGAYMAMMACGKPAYENQISGECGRP